MSLSCSFRQFVGSVGTAFLVAACGATPPSTSTHDVSPGSPKVPPLPAPGTFYSTGLPAYAAAEGLAPNRSEIRLRMLVGRTLPPPPSLDCYAREYSARFAFDGHDPDPGTLRALAQHCGLWRIPPHAHSVTAPSYESLATYVRGLNVHEGPPVLGVGACPHPDGKITVTIVPFRPELRLRPVPREAHIGQVVRLEGQTSRGRGQLVLLTSYDGRAVHRTPLEERPTGEFSHTFEVQAEPTVDEGGRTLSLELARQEGRFLRSLALMPLVDRPATRYALGRADRSAVPTGFQPPGDGVRPDTVDARHQLRAQLVVAANHHRRASGLPPWIAEDRLSPLLDDWLMRVASGNGGNGPPGMVDENGWPYLGHTFTFAAGSSPAQAIELLSETPVGQLALHDPSTRRVAFGIRPFDRDPGFDTVLVATRPFERVEPPQGRKRVLEAIARHRAVAHRAPLVHSPALSAIAQSVADAALVGAVRWETVIDETMTRVRAQRVASGLVGAGALTVIEPATVDLSQEPLLREEAVGFVGIGLMGGPLPREGRCRHIIVYVVAEHAEQ